MPEAERKLNELGYELPPPRTSPLPGNFVSAVRTGNLLYTAGTGGCGVPGAARRRTRFLLTWESLATWTPLLLA